MLERLKLLRNKNKKAGDEAKAEQNVQKAELVNEHEQAEEDNYQQKNNSE